MENHLASQILVIIDNHHKAGRGLIENDLKERGVRMDKSTVIRHINHLIEKSILIKEGAGRNTLYMRDDLSRYLSSAPHKRKQVGYNFELIERYRPNETSYFTRDELSRLEKNSSFNFKDASTYLKNMYVKLVVDLSYASSKLEGNTYSYIDTLVLIEHGEPAEGKSEEETIMILNHKSAINYLFDNIDNIGVSQRTLKDIHSLLSQDLIHGQYVGAVRSGIVGIGGSSYQPLDNRFQLMEELEKTLSTASKIENPFEQSLFLLVHLSYLQAFWDVNKRTSRLTANIPLLKNNLFPLSFITMDKKQYTVGLIAFYELNRIDLIKKQYLESYIRSIDRYKDKADVIKKTGRETLLFRSSLKAGVKRYVAEYPSLTIGKIAARLIEQVQFSEKDVNYLKKSNIDPLLHLKKEIAEAARSLHEDNLIAFGITNHEFEHYYKALGKK